MSKKGFGEQAVMAMQVIERLTPTVVPYAGAGVNGIKELSEKEKKVRDAALDVLYVYLTTT